MSYCDDLSRGRDERRMNHHAPSVSTTHTPAAEPAMPSQALFAPRWSFAAGAGLAAAAVPRGCAAPTPAAAVGVARSMPGTPIDFSTTRSVPGAWYQPSGVVVPMARWPPGVNVYGPVAANG